MVARRTITHIIRLSSTGSTNEVARKLASTGEGEGTVVKAGTQSAGRGRRSREWFSPEGGLWFSVILRPKFPAGRIPMLTLLAGVAVANAVRTFTGLEAGVCWPNDILVNGKKVCGILCEAGGYEKNKFVILGIGINSDFHTGELPLELLKKPTTLRDELGHKVDSEQLFQAVLSELDRLYGQSSKGVFEQVLSEWAKLDVLKGKTVRVNTPSGELFGVASGLDSDGSLLLEAEGKVKRVSAGDVQLIK